MKKEIKVLLACVLFAGALTAGKLAMADSDDKTEAADSVHAEKAQGHLDKAAKYEALAADQQAIIDEHVKMKADEKKRMPPKQAEAMSMKMEKHCNALIAAAEKEKAALTDFAKWHRMRAAELEGK